MRKGYFATKIVVFHSRDEKNNFLNENDEYFDIPRRTASKILDQYEDNDVFCFTCKEKHRSGLLVNKETQ